MKEHKLADAPNAAGLRPFFFMVPFWGERYRRYFVSILLPSLLAPNNLALLSPDQGHQFLLATTREDWDAIAGLPIVARLREHVTPRLVEIPNPKRDTAPGSTNAILHQNLAQKLLVSEAYQARAYGTLFSPDCIISDGMMTSLLRHARAGHRLVLCPALRQSEESAVAELVRRDYLPTDSDIAESAEEINVPPRVLADLMVRHLHPEMAIFQEGAPGQPALPPFRYWRLSRGKGIVLHTFHGAPMLMDFAAIDRHDVACLEKNSFEDVYVARNFGDAGDLHVVGDSDEFCILSLTPAAVGQMAEATNPHMTFHAGGGFVRCLLTAFSISRHSAQMPLKSELFNHSVRWHGEDFDTTALMEEGEISALIARASRYSRFTGLPAKLLLNYRNTAAFQILVPYLRKLTKVLRGDAAL